MSQINDLLEDLEFIRWVKNPDNELVTFWKSWMLANPDRVEDVKFAREIISGMQFPSITPSEQVKSEVLTTILKNVETTSEVNLNELPSHRSSLNKVNWQFLRIAAIISGIVILSLAFLLTRR